MFYIQDSGYDVEVLNCLHHYSTVFDDVLYLFKCCIYVHRFWGIVSCIQESTIRLIQGIRSCRFQNEFLSRLRNNVHFVFSFISRFVTYGNERVDVFVCKVTACEELSKQCDMMFDLLDHILEKNKRRPNVWPLQILLLVLCPVGVVQYLHNMW